MIAGSDSRQQDSGLISSFRHLFFIGVELSLIVCVDLSICELVFMTNKGYCAESSGQQSVAS
jgi:hypothetical protein